MQDLRVVGVENGALLVASDDGSRFRIVVDETLHSKVRQALPNREEGRKPSPKEIQGHIRAGMSAQDVSAITGASLEHIQRFEGPVLAEREFIVESALGVPVRTAMDTDPLEEGSSFGSVIKERLVALGADNERWASWKEASGWIVKLSFTANQIDHDARWGFDPKKLALAPINSEAITLSQQGEMTGALIPRLRAVGVDDREPDSSRFDSGAFDFSHQERSDHEPVLEHPSRGATTAGRPASRSGDTADLLDSLRRKRGQRESANFGDEQPESPISLTDRTRAGKTGMVDISLGDFSDDSFNGNSFSDGTFNDDTFNDDTEEGRVTAPQPVVTPPQPVSAPPQQKSGRKGRPVMPSWDEIVFGARSDDDLG